MANKLSWMLLAMLPAGVLAQQSSQPNYLDAMAKIDAQIAYVQKQTELRDALKKSSGNEGLPKILSIMVDDKGGAAQVVYGSGIVRWLKKGDVLQDGIRVQAINRSAVVAGGGGRKFNLAFYSTQANAAAGAGTDPLPAPPRIHIPLPLAPSVAPASASLAGPVAATPLPAYK